MINMSANQTIYIPLITNFVYDIYRQYECNQSLVYHVQDHITV